MTPVSTTVRLAGAADTDAVVDLVEAAYRGERSRAGWTTEADLLDGRRTGADEVAAVIADPRSRMLLLCEDGRLMGCAVLTLTREHTTTFGMFAVRPTEQGRGRGSRLLAEAESVAWSQLAATTIEMTVIAHRVELIAYYERRGYRRTGERRPFPAHDARFGVPLRDDLQFLVLSKFLAGVSTGAGTS